MRTSATLPAIILAMLLLLLISHTNAGELLTEEQALNALVSQITNDKLYESWTTIACLSFVTEETTKDYFDLAIHEKHGGTCPGDPNTGPIVDRFRVNRLTKKIQWYDPTEGAWLHYRKVLKARLRI